MVHGRERVRAGFPAGSGEFGLRGGFNLVAAETNLARQASRRFDRDVLRGATLYASGEPCPMCAGAIYHSGIGRLVFALGQPRMYEIAGGTGGLRLRASEVLAHGTPHVVVEGPALEDEAVKVLLGR